MTKSKGVGRGHGSGGARPGAGRPKKVNPLGQGIEEAKRGAIVRMDAAKRKAAAELPEAAIPAAAVAGVTPLPKEKLYTRAEVDEMISEAVSTAMVFADDSTEPPKDFAELEPLALKTLRSVMKYGPQDGPRVTAALKVLEKAEARQAAAAPQGKKEAAQAVANARAASGGKFAPPPPPPSVSTRPQ